VAAAECTTALSFALRSLSTPTGPYNRSPIQRSKNTPGFKGFLPVRLPMPEMYPEKLRCHA
jgi:hypothetical protein